VQAFVAAHFVPLRLVLQRKADQPHFRAYQVIWTPTVAILDRRGAAHYHSPGYLPPALFLDMLGIGLARSLLAWARYDEAADQLGRVAEHEDGALAPEALYWLGVARYLKERRRAPMMEAWSRLRDQHPASVWAARIPPNQEEGDEP
jgi:hypothetical protein